MANDKKFVVKKGLATPNIDFANGGGTISATFLSTSNTLSFSGNTGQLFSITDSMSGTIFSVNDISGIPSIEVIDTGSVKIAETFGTVAIGANTLSNYKFYVSGNTLLGNTTFNNSVALTNTSRLGFKTLNGNTVFMEQQNDDNFVLYSTTPTGTSRPVYAVFANSTTSNLQILIPLQINNTLIANSSAGAAGQVLTSTGAGVYWGAAGAGGGSYTFSTGLTNTSNTITVNAAYIATITANNATFANSASFVYGKQESQLSVAASNTALFLQNRTWETAGAIGATVANTGAFTTVSTTGDIQQQNANYLRGRNSSGTSTRLFGVNNANTVYVGGIDLPLGATLFVNNGVEHMRIESSGNVSIGSTATPTKLFVNGHMSVANGFGIYANGVLGANGLVLTSNGTSLFWGSTPAGGFTGNTVSANSTIIKNQSYNVNAAAGWVNMTMPSTVATGDIFIVHSLGGNTRILNNSINIMDVGSGNDLLLENGQTVWLQAVNATAVDVLFTYPAGGTPAVVANSTFATSANNALFANSASFVYGKQESQLSVAIAANSGFATTANNSLFSNSASFAYGKQESQLSVAASNTALYLQNRTWETAGAIGATVANTGAFTTITASANVNLDSGTLFTDATNNRVGINNTNPTTSFHVQGGTLIGGDGVNTYDFKLQRLNSGVRAVQHDFSASTNSPWILHGESLSWTGERSGTVESTQAFRPYYEAFAPAVGYKEFGFANVTSGSFTGSNLIPNLVLTSGGNVGIRTTTPTTSLHVVGNQIRLVNAADTQNILLQADVARAAIQAPNGTLSFDTVSTERMRIDSAGNIGIGALPSGTFRLNVNSASSDNLRLYSLGSTTTLTLANDTNVNQIRSTEGRLGLFHNVVGTMTEGLSLVSGGNVAIGSTTAPTKLYVNGHMSVANGFGIYANGVLGTAGFVLTSNGSSLYWASANTISGTVTSANNASYLNGKQESQLSVASSNSANFANAAAWLGGFQSSYYTNATNISTGTLAEARLPFRMNQNVRTTDDVSFANGTFTGTVSIGGSLILTGNLISTNIQSLTVSDPLIKLGGNNAADTLWGGFTIHYSGSGNTTNHAGLVRNPSTKEFILMSTFGDEVAVANNNTININDTSFSYANLAVSTIRIGNNTIFGTINSNNYSGTANNSTFSYGKQESQLSVANAVYATTAGSVLGGNVSGTVANANNASFLNGRIWETAGAIGSTVANTGAFTTLSASGVATLSANVNVDSGTLFVDATTNRVGIGISSPILTELQVIGHTHSSTGVSVGTDAGRYTPTGYGTTTPNSGIGSNASSVVSVSGFNGITLNTNTTQRLRIDVGGNVSIGESTSTPTKLFVNGHMSVANGFGIYANGTLGANGLVLTSNGTSLYWGSAPAGGFTGNTVSANATIVKNQSYYVNAAAGWVNMTMPSAVVAGDIFIVHSETGNTRILNNSINIMNVGSGNDLLLESGQTVWVQAVNTSSVGIMFTYPAGGTPAVVANSSFATSANNSLYAYGKQESQLSVSSAAQLTTTRTIGDVNFNGTASILPERINFKDTRSVDFAPTTYPGVSIHLKQNGVDNLTDGGTYHGTLNLQHWSDTSGGNIHQLALTDNNNMWLRQSTNSTAWGTWAQVLTTASANTNLNGNVYFSTSAFAINPTFKAYREAVGANTVSTASTVIDLSTFNVFNLSMTLNTTVSFTNPPASGTAYSFMLYCKQDAVGSRTITWPASVKWPNSSPPTMSTGANKIDVFNFFTLDGGTTYLGALSLANTG